MSPVTAPLLRCALLAGLVLSGVAQAQTTSAPLLHLEDLPRPAAPVAEQGSVLPERVEGWRRQAEALEHGDGVTADPAQAAQLYCRAARFGDPLAQYSLAWMLVNGRGIARNDAEAAHLFAAAAEQGLEQARNMADRLGTPRGEPPDCLRAPPIELPQPAAVQRAQLRIPEPPRNAPAVIVNYVRLVAPEYQLAPHLVLAVMATESNFNPAAVSPKNAQGLMQVLPETGQRFRFNRLSDPNQNIRAGMAYLRWLLAYFQGDVPLALAAYNAGERAVERYRGVPPYAETRSYVYRILALINGQREHPFDPSVTTPSPQLAQLRTAAAAVPLRTAIRP